MFGGAFFSQLVQYANYSKVYLTAIGCVGVSCMGIIHVWNVPSSRKASTDFQMSFSGKALLNSERL